ncbi:MAG: class I SAM-dependent methyltransferase [Anaerolineales bacterium]|nr:class I SAM-dependent methyltransferase [Anaerolineales bacterium]
MDWHARYLQQAAWTRNLRAYLFNKAGLKDARRVLEVGCGTGAILRELETPAALHGVDLDPAALTQALVNARAASLTRGNGLSLPYSDSTFDIVYCHYFLLWVNDPLQAVLEMKRVTSRGGYVLALAEPDYSARVDKPEALRPLGEWQRDALKRQGANPGFGAQLAETFFQAGITLKETGTIQGAENEPSVREREMEWAVIEADLAESVSSVEIQKMKRLDEKAWERGERVLYVPTYFAWGQVV